MTRSRRPKSHSAFKQIFASSRCEPLECRRLLSGVADTWTGAGVNSLFSNPANWQGNVAPTSGQDVDFPAAVSNTTVSIDGNMTIGNIEFDAGYTLSSANTITLAGNVTDTVGDVTIDNPIVLGQPVTFLTFDAAKITLNGIISDGGNALGIDKQGNGGLLLAGTGDTYTGQTTGDGGVLIDTAPLASHIGIHVGTTFYGSSSVAAIDGFDGSFNPQTIDTSTQTTAPATLTVNSGIDFTSPSGATMDYEIDGPMQSSQVVVNGGTIDLADTTLSTTVVNGYVPSPGDIITLVQNNTGEPITGTFLNLPQGATTTIDGKPYTISYTGGADHNSVTQLQFNPRLHHQLRCGGDRRHRRRNRRTHLHLVHDSPRARRQSAHFQHQRHARLQQCDDAFL